MRGRGRTHREESHPPKPSFPTHTQQVVYPALDSKVKNVTVAYSVEHQDEVGVCFGCGCPCKQPTLSSPPVRSAPAHEQMGTHTHQTTD